MRQRRNIGVILSGGVGKRFSGALPKQFFKISGKMVLEHTVSVFEKSDTIDEIAIVVSNKYRHIIEDCILRNKWKKVKKILNGGNERYHSTLSAVAAYKGNDVNLVLHDAVRPLLSERILQDISKALLTHRAVDTVIHASDTIVMSDNGDAISSIPNRNNCYQGQTPQAFQIEILEQAYQAALSDPNFISSDDCGTVVKYLPMEPVYMVKGNIQNIKLTYMEDFFLLEKLFQLKSLTLDNGDFSELEGKVLAVFGGSKGIGKSICDIAGTYGAKVRSFSRSQTGTDITSLKSVCNALESVYTEQGRVDYVVATAGILELSVFNNLTERNVNSMIDINFKGAVYTAQAAYKYLKESNGSLLLFTSSSYTYGRPMYELYSASKAAVVNLTQALSQTFAIDGIRVNCLNPERTKTEMRVKNFGTEPESTLLEPEYVAKKALSVLLSSESGQVFDVKKSEVLQYA